MSADKRSVTTDALETLGSIIGPNEKRDAIHLAVEPVIAGQILLAGAHVRLENGVAVSAEVGEGLGIVDPFLRDVIHEGDMFWLVVYPRKISSLRHVWEHPDFPASVDLVVKSNSESKAYLLNLAEHLEISYEMLLAATGEYLTDGEFLIGGDQFEGMYTQEEFWEHYGNVTGTYVEMEKRRNFFGCAC